MLCVCACAAVHVLGTDWNTCTGVSLRQGKQPGRDELALALVLRSSAFQSQPQTLGFPGSPEEPGKPGAAVKGSGPGRTSYLVKARDTGLPYKAPIPHHSTTSIT